MHSACLHFMKHIKANKHRFFALNLDLRKAYDRIDLGYLDAIMLKLGVSEVSVDVTNHVSSIVN